MIDSRSMVKNEKGPDISARPLSVTLERQQYYCIPPFALFQL